MPSAHSITPFIIDCFSLVGLFALARCAHNPFLQLKSKPNQRKDKFYSSFTNQSFSPSIKDNFLSLRKREERDWWGPLHKNLWFLITAAANFLLQPKALNPFISFTIPPILKERNERRNEGWLAGCPFAYSFQSNQSFIFINSKNAWFSEKNSLKLLL